MVRDNWGDIRGLGPWAISAQEATVPNNRVDFQPSNSFDFREEDWEEERTPFTRADLKKAAMYFFIGT